MLTIVLLLGILQVIQASVNGLLQKYSGSVLGAIKSERSNHLVVVSQQIYMGKLFGQHIFQAAQVESIPLSDAKQTPTALSNALEYLNSVHVYYASQGNYSLAATVQCTQDSQSCPDPLDYYTDNRLLLQNLESITPNSSGYTVRAIRGNLEMKCFGSSICLALISRTSPFRTGTRLWARGLDDNGHAGNTVESELIVSRGKHVASWTQVRGSMPFCWMQTPSYTSFSAAASICDDQVAQKSAFGKHVEIIKKLYRGKCTAISLIEGGDGGKAAEVKLGSQYEDLASDNEDFKLLPFDLHKQLKSGKWEDVLDKQLEEPLGSISHFSTNGSRQSGVIRTSCLSTLDRTSSVQKHICSLALSRLLQEFNVQTSDEMTSWLGEAWVSTANAISYQYAGTATKKENVIRGGRVGILGLIKDVSWLSIGRYYRSNFKDKDRNDGMALLYGCDALKRTCSVCQ